MPEISFCPWRTGNEVITSDWSTVQTTDFEVQEQKYGKPVTWGVDDEEDMDEVDLNNEEEERDGEFPVIAWCP
jgi:hypothetical protein